MGLTAFWHLMSPCPLRGPLFNLSDCLIPSAVAIIAPAACSEAYHLALRVGWQSHERRSNLRCGPLATPRGCNAPEIQARGDGAQGRVPGGPDFRDHWR